MYAKNFENIWTVVVNLFCFIAFSIIQNIFKWENQKVIYFIF